MSLPQPRHLSDHGMSRRTRSHSRSTAESNEASSAVPFILMLPDEILDTIFRLVCQQSPAAAGTLSLVCRRFRDVAEAHKLFNFAWITTCQRIGRDHVLTPESTALLDSLSPLPADVVSDNDWQLPGDRVKTALRIVQCGLAAKSCSKCGEATPNQPIDEWKLRLCDSCMFHEVIPKTKTIALFAVKADDLAVLTEVNSPQGKLYLRTALESKFTLRRQRKRRKVERTPGIGRSRSSSRDSKDAHEHLSFLPGTVVMTASPLSQVTDISELSTPSAQLDGSPRLRRRISFSVTVDEQASDQQDLQQHRPDEPEPAAGNAADGAQPAFGDRRSPVHRATGPVGGVEQALEQERRAQPRQPDQATPTNAQVSSRQAQAQNEQGLNNGVLRNVFALRSAVARYCGNNFELFVRSMRSRQFSHSLTHPQLGADPAIADQLAQSIVSFHLAEVATLQAQVTSCESHVRAACLARGITDLPTPAELAFFHTWSASPAQPCNAYANMIRQSVVTRAELDCWLASWSSFVDSQPRRFFQALLHTIPHQQLTAMLDADGTRLMRQGLALRAANARCSCSVLRDEPSTDAVTTERETDARQANAVDVDRPHDQQREAGVRADVQSNRDGACLLCAQADAHRFAFQLNHFSTRVEAVRNTLANLGSFPLECEAARQLFHQFALQCLLTGIATNTVIEPQMWLYCRLHTCPLDPCAIDFPATSQRSEADMVQKIVDLEREYSLRRHEVLALATENDISLPHGWEDRHVLVADGVSGQRFVSLASMYIHQLGSVSWDSLDAASKTHVALKQQSLEKKESILAFCQTQKVKLPLSWSAGRSKNAFAQIAHNCLTGSDDMETFRRAIQAECQRQHMEKQKAKLAATVAETRAWRHMPAAARRYVEHVIDASNPGPGQRPLADALRRVVGLSAKLAIVEPAALRFALAKKPTEEGRRTRTGARRVVHN